MLSPLTSGGTPLFTLLYSLPVLQRILRWTKKAILDGGLYVRGISSVQMHSHISGALSFFLLFTRDVKICLQSLRFRPQAVINYRHVSTAQDPTFAAPSLRHGPHHYPRKQQQQQQLRWRRKASAISDLEEFSPPASLSAASIRHHCGAGFH